MYGGERQTLVPSSFTEAPTIGQSVGAAFKKPFEELGFLGASLSLAPDAKQERLDSAARIQSLNDILEDPRQGYTQKGLNGIAGIAGSIIPTLPLFLSGGVIAGGVAGAIGLAGRTVLGGLGSEVGLESAIIANTPISKLATGPLSYYLPNASAKGIATGVARAYGEYKGFIIPEHLVENYNPHTDTINVNHAIEDWGGDNYGFLLAATPLAAGYIGFKAIRGTILKRRAGIEAKAADEEVTRLLKEHFETQIKRDAEEAKVSELQEHLQQAEDEGKITPKMHEWYLDFLENPNDITKVHEGGLDILRELQIPFDRFSGRVWHEVLDRASVKNLKGAIQDQLSTNFSKEENQLLSEYVVHNQLDNYIVNMRDNPNLLSAIKGMTGWVDRKIENRGNAILKIEAASDRIIPKVTKKNELFSQNNIYKHLVKIGNPDISQIPYTVTSRIRYKLNLKKRLDKLALKNRVLISKNKYKKWSEKDYDVQKKILDEFQELKEQIKNIKLQNPLEELTHIRNTLLKNGKLIKKFRTNKLYHRLEELAQLWPAADAILNRIKLETLYDKQEALNNVLKKFTQMVDDNATRLASPDSVKRYLNTRLEKTVPRTEEFRDYRGARIATDEVTAVTAQETSVIEDSNKSIVENSELEFAKDEFKITSEKIAQLRENEMALAELIECELGI